MYWRFLKNPISIVKWQLPWAGKIGNREMLYNGVKFQFTRSKSLRVFAKQEQGQTSILSTAN